MAAPSRGVHPLVFHNWTERSLQLRVEWHWQPCRTAFERAAYLYWNSIAVAVGAIGHRCRFVAAAGTRSVLLSRIRGATDKPPACPSTRRSTGTEVLVEGGQTDGRFGLLGLLRRGLGTVRGCGLVELREEGTRTCSASARKKGAASGGQGSYAGPTGRSGRRDPSSEAVAVVFIRHPSLERTGNGSRQSEGTGTGTGTAGWRRATCKCKYNCKHCRTTRSRRVPMMHNHGELDRAARRRARLTPAY